MSRKNNRNNSVLPQSVLEDFKWEVAEELGLSSKIKSQGWENMTSRECGHVGGRIGGSMVKTMIRRAKESLNNPSL
ncbi:alpha/beta-type small acid-soluble spore protein [Desulfosporosinus sp.]|uniref:alpha/beta-type small acid-soluble spore protein n=1 Tax=Desulfosporosinus sp. TaxID=157907 RepID=UPI000E801DA8|nr:alpha/beta-type small acid-soluble spore protein [Desulfosporosinus sp.]MBC2723189.1 alpha/beta-type small acid-soluble spore protein [Desulfosporosinus sp.]MBC2727341.1 alpha/beta-type small acid-soluble spore protein [Desulfosporosinus sp.]HBV86937.1 spore protein alpha/beta [Desulfosporosinus sp.]